jgi:hypothetical protein
MPRDGRAWNTRPTEDKVEALIEALTPSAETKAAYLGEFKMSLVRTDECGDEYTENVTVSWDAIKEIMAAIRTRASHQQERDRD